MNLEVISRPPSEFSHSTPLLFVHGAWHGAWCWTEHFLDHFASHGYSAYALSLRGHGASPGRDQLRWTSLSDYVADVAQVASQMSVPPIVIGHSMGGAIVQKYLETYPAPAAVLLASVPPAGIIASTIRIARRHPGPVANGIFRLTLYPLVSTPDLTREAFFSPGLSQDKLMSYFAQLQDESYRAFLDMMMFNLPKSGRINTPIQVIGAENDTIFSHNEIEATARAYRTKAEIFPDMAHDMMLETGWQSVADHIIGWLSEKGF
jgi:pimeloyl-ACP methyl ester carboxylesterase